MDYFFLILKAMTSVFLNPIFYWIVILSFLPSDNRIRLEEAIFGQKILPLRSEVKNTFSLSLVMTTLLLVFTISFKVSLPYEAIIILSVIMILLSFRMKFVLLSASYTLGFTYLVLWFLPKGPLESILYTDWTFISIAILIAIFLFGEAILFLSFKNSEAAPRLAYSKRGRWYGILQMKKLSIIPFIVFLPQETGTLTNSILPNLFIGDESYTLFIMPFAIGFNHLFRGDLPEKYSKNIGFSILLLSLTVLTLSLAGIKIENLSFLAVVIAILGRFIIHYYFYRLDVKKTLYFLEGQEELRVLAVIYGSLAEKQGFQTGDTIVTVNGEDISSLDQLNELLLKKEDNYLVEINRKRSRRRFIKVKDFQGNTKQLGIVFAGESYKN